MAEFLRDEFPDLDVYSGVEDPEVLKKFQDDSNVAL